MNYQLVSPNFSLQKTFVGSTEDSDSDTETQITQKTTESDKRQAQPINGEKTPSK